MNVIICKFISEEGIEHAVRELIAIESKGTGNSSRVLCVDKGIQKRLNQAGITSEIPHEFQLHYGYDNEAVWDEAYKLSDELHSSIENDNSLKYHGINFLTLENNLPHYVFTLKFSILCQRLVEEGCNTMIIVLTKPYTAWVSRIDTPGIKTITYGRNAGQSGVMAVQRYYMVQLISSLPEVSTGKNYPVNMRETGKQKKVLFVVYAPLYARPALSICKECLKNELSPYIAPYSSVLTPLFQNFHVEHSKNIWFTSLVSFALHTGKVLHLLYRLKRHVRSFYSSSNNLDTESDRFSVKYLFSRILLNELPYLCFQAIHHIIFLERIIKTISPELICVMPDGGFWQQIASALAKKHGIPTLACGAAIDTGSARSYMRHLYADKIAAMGEVSKNIYIESGLDAERIAVTGTAHFDRLFDRDEELDKRVLEEHDLDPGRQIIVFSTENLSLSETVEALVGVIDAVLKMETIHLVVKVHPGEDMGPYQTLVDEYHDPRIHVIKDIDLYSLISNCVLLIAKYSTTALEAMMIDKPVLIINLSGEKTPVPYAEEGAALGVYRYEDIEQSILKALYDEETRAKYKSGRHEFVRKWACEPDGMASQRIIKLMKEMIAEVHGTR